MGYLELMYLDGQATLDELRMYFPNYNIYILDAELVVVVRTNGNVLVTFEKLEDDVYQVYDTNYDNVKFAEVAHLWGDTIKEVQHYAVSR
jgi:hypothetical protein